MATTSAADIPVTTVNDSGPGSLRAGLASANSGDVLVFQTSLDGDTLINGPTLDMTVPVTLSDSSSIFVNDPHAYSLNGPLSINWAGNLALTGVIANGTSTGSLINNGLGTLLLSGTNTFTGGVTTNGGAISLLNSAGLGTGTLTVTNTVGTPSLELSNGLNVTNKISLQSDLTVNVGFGSSSQLSGVISGASPSDGLTTISSGTLTLSGANTFAGGVFVTDPSTLSVQNNSALGTGILSNSGPLTLNLSSGISLNNPISLGSNLTVGVATGTATLSGNITQTAPSQLNMTGAGTLVLSGTNSFTGGISVNQGTLQGDSNSLVGTINNTGSLIFNQTATGTYSGDLIGSGTVTKTGTGTLILTGSSVPTGITTVSAGGIQVMGTYDGPITLSNSAASLSGTGTVGTVINQGIVQPGTTNIGILTVNGNYTQSSSGTTDIKINSTGNTPGVNNDNLQISGTATLNGTLNVIGNSGSTYTPGTEYTIINSAGGVSGQFTDVRTNLPDFRVNATYDPNDVMFRLQPTTSLGAAATTANQFGVGSALDNIATTSTGSLYTMIGDLGVLSADQQRQALNQLSGEMYGNLQNMGLEIGSQFQQRVTNAMVSNANFLTGNQSGSSSDSGVRGQSNNVATSRVWSQGYGFGGAFRGDGNAGTLNFGQGGGIMGFELADETTRVGVVGGSGYGGFNDSFGGGGQVGSSQLGMYSIIDNGDSYILGSANYGFNQYFTHRTVSIAGVDQFLRADYTGNQIGANVETGLKLSAGFFHIQPLVGLQYLYLCQQGFDESGGTAGLDVARTRANSLRASIGARVATDPFEGRNGSIWTPFTHARIVGDMLDNDRIINASFNGAPVGGAFSSQGTRIGQAYGLIGQGVEVRLNSIWSLYGGAEATIGERTMIGTGSVGAVTLW